MKKMCFVVFLYGEIYQWYIPIYVYSINKSYPEYDIRIYIYENLYDNVKKALENLKFLKNYTIIDNVRTSNKYKVPHILEAQKNNNLSNICLRSTRWLLYDEAFEQYNAIYIGDIDIFVARERYDMYDQHVKHCEYIGLPFSNMSRRWNKRQLCGVKKNLADMKRYGLCELLRKLRDRRKYICRLSGLHFVIVKEYFPKVRPLFEIYQQELENIVKAHSTKWNKCFFDDEAVLFDLVKEAGFSVHKMDSHIIEKESPSVRPDNSLVNNYRPHHGLHLGMWRNKDVSEKYPSVIRSDVYREYYRQFCYLRETDRDFEFLLRNESEFVKEIIQNMDECMEKIL